MDNRGYTLIQDWMLDLDLDVYETIIYAVIFGFSQDGETKFSGSWSYLMKKAKCSRRKVSKALSSLVEKNLVKKNDVEIKGIHICEYEATCTICMGGAPHALGSAPRARGGAPHAPNNIVDNKDINNLSLYKGSGFDFLQSLIDLGVSEDVAKAFMQVRKAKKATNTEVAFNGLKREIDKASVYFQKTPDDCIRICVENSWKGFKADWLNESQRQRPAQPQRRESVMEHNMRAIDQMFGTDYHNQYYGNPKPQTPDYDEQ